jgi:hypothetical protein
MSRRGRTFTRRAGAPSAGPIFDSWLVFEMLNFFGDDVVEGAKALREKRPPVFPSAQG